VTGAVQRRAESEIDASYWIWMTILGEPYLSESRLFRIRQIPGISIANLNIAAKAFVDAVLMPAVNRLNEWGFKFPSGSSAEPRTVEVSFERLSGAEKLLCGGDVYYDARDGEVRIRLNSRLIEYDAKGPSYAALSRKVVHVLFQYVRFPDGPPAATYPWLWMDEAVATYLELQQAWSEGLTEFDPLQEMAFWNFAPRGLEASAVTTDREELMIHGWGASRFLKELILVKGTTLLKELYQVHGTALGSALKPVEVLRSDVLPTRKVDLSYEWERFVEDMGPDTFLLPDRTNLADAVGSRNGTLLGEAGEKVVFNWSAPHLSAQFFQVNMPAQWSSGLALSAAATGDSDITVYYYRVPASGPAVALPEKNAFERKPPETVFKSGDRLWIVAVNKKAVSPFTSRTPVSITVQVQAPPNFLPTLRLANYLHVGIEVPICSAGSPICPKTLGITNWLEIAPQVPNLPFTPANWTDAFRITGKASTAANDESVDISVEFNDTGDVLKRLVADYSWTYREGSIHVTVVRTKFTIEGLPHTYPAKPGTSAYQKFSAAGADAAKYLKSYDWSVTVDDEVKGKVTGLNWNGSGAPGIYVTFDKN
jgi:hypothetical protein